jgi:hypothetical protein
MQTQLRVFDDITRTDTAPGKRNGSDFEFINDSARPKANQARTIIETWFEHLPDNVKPEFRARLRQRDNQHFRATFFELYLHELLIRAGFTVEFHPDSEKGKRPDFKVYRDGVAVFCLEGRAAGDSVAKSAKQHIIDDAYDAIDRIPCPDLFLHITVEGEPKSPVPVKRGLRKELEAWIAGLDYDAVAAMARAGHHDLMPTYAWEHDGWRLVFTALPKKEHARGKPGSRPIGMVGDGIAFCARTGELITNAVADKAGRYGKLDLPYIIAVNVLDQLGVDEDDMWLGLTTALGDQRTTVSAVLIVPELWNPIAAASSVPSLVHNPSAARPLPRGLWPLSQFTIGRHEIEEVVASSVSAAGLLGLIGTDR